MRGGFLFVSKIGFASVYGVLRYEQGKQFGEVTRMGAIVFLWIILVVVAFENHQDTLVAWVLGVTFVLGVIGAMIHASSEEKEALERVKREKQDQDTIQPASGATSPSEIDKAVVAYTTARETMRRRLHFMELKYPLDLSKERTRGQSPIEAALQRAEARWQSSKSYHPYDFFRLADNINALQMWVTDEDMEAFYADAYNLHRHWEGWMWLNVLLPPEKIEHRVPDRTGLD